MFCPNCKYEYGKEATFCPDCQVDLVAQLPEYTAVNPVRIKFVSNQSDAELVMNLLRENGIQCFSKCRETGGYMNIYMGYSVYGEDIYVDRDDSEKALELLEFLTVEPEPVDEEDGNMDNNAQFGKTHRTAIKVTFIVAAGVMILGILLPVVLYFMNS